ncbi:DNA-binding domain-containing protein [Haliea sp. E17]|uniref:HvfC family RiPP maturation protein n=1 Tax=Haliea sp. E17 TaxID=3401576 RepID=UPI003AAFDEB6
MSTLRDAQLAMAAHLRDPQRHPAPAGIEERRLQVYRDLIYNNIENFIRSGFPVLHSLYLPEDWHSLVRAFMDTHRCRSPLFPEISQEFLQFLIEEHRPRDCDPPFMVELAHYEWVELALDIADLDLDLDLPPAHPPGDLTGQVLQLSPLAWVLAYQYPVHLIGRDYQPREPQPTWLAVYRNRGDEVRFMALTAATARLLELLRDNSQATVVIVEKLAAELGMQVEQVHELVVEQLDMLVRAEVILPLAEGGENAGPRVRH